MDQTEEVKEKIMDLVACARNQRLRPHEVERTLLASLGVPGDTAKTALKELIEEERLVYSYHDPCSYVEIPVQWGHHAARPMKVVVDRQGNSWICDKEVDPSGDLAEQGCWRCGDLPFTRND